MKRRKISWLNVVSAARRGNMEEKYLKAVKVQGDDAASDFGSQYSRSTRSSRSSVASAAAHARATAEAARARAAFAEREITH